MGDATKGASEYKPDQVLEHSFDGIQENDNRLPNWWLVILFVSIIFSFGYWLYYHTFEIGPSSEMAYEQEMAQVRQAELDAAREGGMTDETLLMVVGMPEKVAAGAKLFQAYCVSCHLDKGQGSVGPNLTDEFWIHGGGPTQIYATITDGVPAKGMIAWGPRLGPTRVEEITAFVLAKVKGTNVSGKAAEGSREEPRE